MKSDTEILDFIEKNPRKFGLTPDCIVTIFDKDAEHRKKSFEFVDLREKAIKLMEPENEI